MNIIDFHVHIFPDKIARKASRAVGRFYDLYMNCDGTLSGALAQMDQAGIGRCVAHSVATTPAQVDSINRFLLECRAQYPDRIIPFAAMHPDLPDIPGVMDEIVAAGFCGVKIHPDIQGFQIDSERSMRMIESIAGRLPLLIHTGDRRYDFSGPTRMNRVLEACPNLVAICAHLGAQGEWQNAEKLMRNENVYVDTSSSLYALPAKRAVELIRSFGTDRVLFGTDYPMWTARDEMERFDRLDLTDAERDGILHGNAERLLRL